MQEAADRGTNNFAGGVGPPSLPTMTRLSSATSLAGLTALAFMSSSAMALTPMENWRQTYFGTTTNAGNASDNADPDCRISARPCSEKIPRLRTTLAS